MNLNSFTQINNTNAMSPQIPGAHWLQISVQLVSQIASAQDIGMHMCVYPPPRPLITSGIMWRDMNPIQMVTQILKLIWQL